MSRIIRAALASNLAFACAFVLLLAPSLIAQSPADTPHSEEPVTTLKSGVELVNVYFNVKDKHGMLIPGLGKDEFTVEEDGVPQTIKYFSAETNLPLTLAILIDSSGSQARVLEIEKEVGGQFLREFLKEKDEATIISFDVTVDLLQDFTNSPSELSRALNKAKINSGVGGSPGLGGGPIDNHNPAGTVLYDAVYVASREKLSTETGRKAIILLTDGEDQGSKLNIKNAVEAAQKADAVCYVLLIADRGLNFGFGAGAMRQLTDDTGGRVIEVGNRPDKLKEAFKQISDELRSLYNVGYTPITHKQDGSFLRLNVKSKQGYKVQSRKGYYAASE